MLLLLDPPESEVQGTAIVKVEEPDEFGRLFEDIRRFEVEQTTVDSDEASTASGSLVGSSGPSTSADCGTELGKEGVSFSLCGGKRQPSLVVPL